MRTGKIFGSVNEAAAALVSRRNARFISGGSLPMPAGFRECAFRGGFDALKRRFRD